MLERAAFCVEGSLAPFRHQGGNMPSEAIRAQNLVRALCQLASCPFPILSLNENAPEFPSNNNQPESKIPVSQTPLYPGPCGRVSASGRNERFQEEQPGLCGHIHLENHHPALKLALVSQGVASGSSPLWAQVLPDGGHGAEGCRNPEEAEATAGNAAPPPFVRAPISQLSKATWCVSKGQLHFQENAF